MGFNYNSYSKVVASSLWITGSRQINQKITPLSPLAYAIRQNHHDIVEQLLSAGASVEFPTNNKDGVPRSCLLS